MKQLFNNNKNNIWFWAFLVLIVGLFFVLPLMSRDAGNSGDEDRFQWPYGEQIYNFYATGGKDTTCLADDDMGMHGGFFDQLTVVVVKAFNVEDYSQLRHGMNAFFGWVGILFAGLLAYRLRNWRAAVITVILLFLSPRYLGHSFNNPKDLIFASMMMASIYYIFQLVRQYPKPKISTSILLAVFSSLAIVSRFAGMLLFSYLVLFLIIYHICQNKKKSLSLDSWKIVGRYVIFVAAIGIVTFGLSIAMWPYIMDAPVKTMMKVFHSMSSYFVSIRQVFEGNMLWSDFLPWYYTPKYILITAPIAVLIGLVLFFVFCWRKKEDRFWSLFLFFTFFFPVFWIVYTHANVYGGWRHALFAYPTMAVAAGVGFNGLAEWVENKLQAKSDNVKAQNLWVNVGTAVLLLVLLIGPIRHVIANHPYEYVYFNELVGGTKNQLGKYELDYYYNSTREATEWVIANAEKKPDGSKTTIATWHTASVQYFSRKDTDDFQVSFVRWYEKENSDWDYAIFTVTGMAPEYLRSKNFPPKNTVKTIDVDGVPIAIILKRQDKSDYEAFVMKQDPTKLDSVAMLYKKALKVDPDNLGALLGIGETYVRMNKPDSALIYLNHYHDIDKESEMANYMTAYAYLYKGDNNAALDVLRKIQKHNPKYSAAYVLAIQIYLQTKDFVAVKKQFDKAIDVDQMNDQLTQLWVQYKGMQGIDQQNAYIQLYKAMAASCEKRGKKEEAQRYREAIGLK